MSTGSVPNTTAAQAYSSPPITIILTVIILAFFFIGFFSLYFCRCLMQNLIWTWHLRHSPNGTPVGPAGPANLLGLDPKIIQSFPTFIYSTVKDYRKEKYGLECAICLVEFGNDDVLRLLTSCCHVFHQECIDLWLGSHNTCPVCRRGLDSAAEASPEKSPIAVNSMHDSRSTENSAIDDSFVVISIKDENEEDDKCEREHSGSENEQQVEGRNNDKVAKFSRSHSTGHSIVRSREEEDRFTLRLPEHVKAKILQGHNPTRSCINFGEFKSTHETTLENNGGFGEVAGLSNGDHINRV